jgi:hypothetical protein
MGRKDDRKMNLGKMANARWGRLAKRIGLRDGWKNDALWLWTFATLDRSQQPMVDDLGAIPFERIDHVFAKYGRGIAQALVMKAKESMGHVGVSALLSEIKDEVCEAILSDEGEDDEGSAPAMAEVPDSPDDSGAAGMTVRPSFDVSAYA